MNAAPGPPLSGESTRQPFLHEAVLALKAPTQVWSGTRGDLGAEPVHGVYLGDTRVLSRLEVRVGDESPEVVAHGSSDAGSVWFSSLVRTLDDGAPDPRVRLHRTRTVDSSGVDERLELSSALENAVETDLVVHLDYDFSTMPTIKGGHPVPRAPGRARSTRLSDGIAWRQGGVRVSIHAPDAVLATTRSGATVRWRVRIPPHGSVTIDWRIELTDDDAVVFGAAEPPSWASFSVAAGDSRVARWVRRGLDDLAALRMTAAAAPGQVFIAAGAPWFLTLFGRDSLWAARFLLPLDLDLAVSTLRVLAVLQGTREVAETAEQPGKIMHELRGFGQTLLGDQIELPPLYYGTIDATPLWIILLHDAWRWGMGDEAVRELLPNLEAALAWMRDFGDSDGDGFLEYVDETGHGLTNQGWKDSGDSIQGQDGTLAQGPIALCEVQGYAYQAAIAGAELLDHFGGNGADWRQWAAVLKVRFAETFWVEAAGGRYPAVALDIHKKRVDSLTSNIGHLLGTGLLDEEESRLVADRLVAPQLNSGYGIRTLSSDSVGYWPLSYHGGTVWTHDTAIAIAGLARAGFADEAVRLIDGLLAAAEGFDYRLPELHSGDAADLVSTPVPYPAACRPQAWSAAAAIAVLTTLLGLHADAPNGQLAVVPLPNAVGIEVDALRFDGQSVALRTDANARLIRNTLDGSALDGSPEP